MRRALVCAVALALALACAEPAAAWDPFAEETSDPMPAGGSTDPAPFVVPDGIYVVTDVYAGDVVASAGRTTTYSTTTTHETPGTFARVLDSVGTGGTSANDGRSMNGRARLPDGRLVAGTYYQDFVLTGEGYVAVNIVFFQDDSISVDEAPTAVPTPTPTAAARATSAPTPMVRTPAPVPTSVATARPSVATAGLALGPTAPVLSSIEVLRGRRVAIWPRAFLDGSPVQVRGWRLVSAPAGVASVTAGDGGTPCDATFLTLAPAGAGWTLRFEVTSDALPGRVLFAQLHVLVRSPALEQ